MDKIYDAHDKAHEEGYKNAQERVQKLCIKFGIMPKNGDGRPINAYIERGRWLAACECGGKEYVAENVGFMCFSCGNVADGSRYRPVVFPPNRDEIEAELLRREVVPFRGTTATQLARQAIPRHGAATRSWNVGESVKTLRKQYDSQKAVK